MNLWKSLAGMVQVELTSAAPTQVLGMISEQNIPVFHVNPVSDLTSQFLIYRKDYAAVSALCEKRGEILKQTGKKGIYWTMCQLRKRPLLLSGIICLMLLSVLIPRYVFFVEVTGNDTLPANQILEAAQMCGVTFGASRKKVRSERIKNELLDRLPQLQWAGVNTRGCVAVISVRERAPSEERSESRTVSSIVADRDGIILSCTSTRGNLLCSEGQAVRAGEILISGYTDCGISICATRAEGEVYARTLRKLDVAAPKNWVMRGEQKSKKYAVSLRIEKNRINLWKDSGIWDATCGRMYKEYYVTLPGGFTLPVALCVETFTQWETFDDAISAQEAIAADFAQGYLSDQMVAGTILSSTQTLTEQMDYYLQQGSYVCKEMIGREKSEKMGDANEQTD